MKLGSIIDKLHALREERRALSKEDKALKADFDENKATLIEHLDEQGTKRASSDFATASITESDVGTIAERERFWKWIMRTKRYEMLTWNISQPALREYIEQSRGNKPPPGIEMFTKRDISLTKLK